MGKPRNARKYPTYPEIPGNKKDTRIYLIVYFDTPTRPEPDPLPGILSNTRPDPILKNPTRWALFVCPMILHATVNIHFFPTDITADLSVFAMTICGNYHIIKNSHRTEACILPD